MSARATRLNVLSGGDYYWMIRNSYNGHPRTDALSNSGANKILGVVTLPPKFYARYPQLRTAPNCSCPENKSWLRRLKIIETAAEDWTFFKTSPIIDCYYSWQLRTAFSAVRTQCRKPFIDKEISPIRRRSIGRFHDFSLAVKNYYDEISPQLI